MIDKLIKKYEEYENIKRKELKKEIKKSNGAKIMLDALGIDEHSEISITFQEFMKWLIKKGEK